MDQVTFKKVKKFIYDQAGIDLADNKLSLVSARLRKRMSALDIPTHAEYFSYVKSDKSGLEIINLLDVISTNVTNFFREPDHFDFVRKVFLQWVDKGQSKFRFWSAASSTGEEPYTLGMVLLEALGGKKKDVKILATDISTSVLRSCKEGIYEERKLSPVNAIYKNKYFTKETLNGENYFRVINELQKLMLFRRLNLSKPPYPMRGPLDAVFCRNVMIYFDDPHRNIVLKEVAKLLKPGGYLFVGHSESLSGLKHNFKTVSPSVYQNVEGL